MTTDLSPCSRMIKALAKKDCGEGMSRVCLSVTLILMAALSLSACVRVELVASGGYEPPPSEPQRPREYIPTEPVSIAFSSSNAPLCQLQPPITTVHKQENSAWCWAASTSLVVNHLEPNRALKQCKAVHTTLEPEIEEYETLERAKGRDDVHVYCCLVTDEEMRNYIPNNPTPRPTDKYVQDSVSVCHTTARPEWALDANGYRYRFSLVRWDPDSTSPQGLSWDELTSQICINRPFISVKLWVGEEEGGTHTEVVTGYRLDPDAWVVLDTHGMDGFHSIPYDDYLGKPGEWVHVRDYVDIGL